MRIDETRDMISPHEFLERAEQEAEKQDAELLQPGKLAEMAACETLRKAQLWDEWADLFHTQFKLDAQDSPHFMLGAIGGEKQFYKKKADALRAERDELAALVDSIREQVSKKFCHVAVWSEKGQLGTVVVEGQKVGSEDWTLLDLTRGKGEATLTERDARVRRDAFADFLRRQREFSSAAFGLGKRTKGLIEHISKELKEIEADPTDLSEFVDVILLAMDGFWRHGGKPEELLPALEAKLAKNLAREWPAPTSEDHAIEHVKDAAELHQMAEEVING